MGIPAIIAASGIQALGAIQQSQAAAASAGYNAKIAGMNAQIEKQKAAWAAAEGEQTAGLAGIKSQQQAGDIKVAQAANNIDVNKGSAVAVQKSQAEMGMLNEMNIRSNAARAAYGYETGAANEEAQVALDRKQQSYSKTAGYINAAGSLLGGAASASMYDKWLGSTGLGSTTTGSGAVTEGLGGLY